MIGDVRPSTVKTFPSDPFSTSEIGLDLTGVELPELRNGLVDSAVNCREIRKINVKHMNATHIRGHDN